jgi:hypothetical protein
MTFFLSYMYHKRGTFTTHSPKALGGMWHISLRSADTPRCPFLVRYYRRIPSFSEAMVSSVRLSMPEPLMLKNKYSTTTDRHARRSRT